MIKEKIKEYLSQNVTDLWKNRNNCQPLHFLIEKTTLYYLIQRKNSKTVVAIRVEQKGFCSLQTFYNAACLFWQQRCANYAVMHKL